MFGRETPAEVELGQVELPYMLTLSFTLKFSVSMASTRPIKPSRGPAVICTVSPTLKSTVSGAAFSTPIFSTSSAERGTGLEAGPTKPVQPRVLRTTYQVSSFITILTRT